MHSEIREDGPGECPICGMTLIKRGRADLAGAEIILEPGVRQNMNLRTTEVRRQALPRRIDTVGRVTHDESLLTHIHPRLEGWIQDMDVSDEGERIRAGQRLFTLYSPELVNAQDDFLSALRQERQTLIDSSRGRLRALGVQPAVISAIESDRERRIALPWYATRDGYVVQLGARAGMHVSPGSEILVLTDHSRVWVIADVFPRNAQWITRGQPAEVDLDYLPGETFVSEVDYVYPELDPVTRTLRVRLSLDNPEGRLKPGMWTSVRIDAGRGEERVVIPSEALIRTGKSSRVVVARDESFEVREVVPGRVADDRVTIDSGLEAGERVVVSGQFLIDSEASLRAGHTRLEGHGDH